MASFGDTQVITRRVGTVLVIIPCFELLRVLYYGAGAALVDLFFSGKPLSAVCRAIEGPTPQNGYTARIALLTEAFDKKQRCVLGELCFNADYRRTVEMAHSDLLRDLRTTPGGAYPRVDLHTGRDVHFNATGFAFTADWQEYFFVCGLWLTKTPFGFLKLDPHPLVEHSQGPAPATGAGDEEYPGAVRFRTDSSDNPPLDPEASGSSRHADATVVLEEDPGVAWPEVVKPPRRAPTPHRPAPTRYVPNAPAALSLEGGGDDETRAAATTETEGSRKTVEPINQTLLDYFNDFAEWFRQKKGFAVEALQVNNATGEHGEGLSVLATGPIRHLGILQIAHGERFYYFFQLLTKGRAAFVHKATPTKMSEADLGALLAIFALVPNTLDWEKVNETSVVLNSTPGMSLEATMQEELFIYPRNHGNGGAATAALCARTIRGRTRTVSPTK